MNIFVGNLSFLATEQDVKILLKLLALSLLFISKKIRREFAGFWFCAYAGQAKPKRPSVLYRAKSLWDEL